MGRRRRAKKLWTVLQEAGNGFADDKVIKLSGSLAYFTVFSIGPMLIVILYLAGLVYKDAEVTVFNQIASMTGPDTARQIQQLITNLTQTRSGNLAAIIGFVTLIVGATGVFAEIQDSINLIWNLKPKPKKGWLKMLLNRLLSFSVVISLGFILLVSLIINGLIENFMGRLQARYPELAVTMVYVINLLLTFGITTLLFGIIFKVLPDAIIRWKDVTVGAMTTAALFMLGKFGITYYISNSNIASTYGAAGSLVILLSWVYYSSVILYFGAEFTKAYAAHFGSRIVPSHYAVWVKNVEIEEDKDRSLKQQEQSKKDQNENTGDHITVK